ncbi:MAG: ATP-dependent DNA helicase RecG [Deltaproteobacteria bacterium]
MKELSALLEALEKPLRFAAKNGFQNIQKVKFLEELAEELTLKALALALLPQEASAVARIRGSFAGYENLPLESKKEVITRSLRVIESVGAGRSDSPNVADNPTKPPKTVAESANTPTVVAQINNVKRAEAPDAVKSDPALMPIQFVKGVGPRIAEILYKKGIKTAEDALYHFPKSYEDRRHIRKISELKPDLKQTVTGRVVVAGKIRAKTRELFQVILSDGTGDLSLVWFKFNEKYLKNLYKKGVSVILTAEVKLGYRDALQILHPKPEDTEIIEDEDDPPADAKDLVNLNRITPIYPLTEGIKQRRIRGIIKTLADERCPRIQDPAPEESKERAGLMPLGEALGRVHFPADSDGVVDLGDASSVYGSPPHRTLAFHEFFLMELGIAMKKRDAAHSLGIAFKPTGELVSRLIGMLKFTLTAAQRRVISEIERDMQSERPMNRLLQGDVGSGKTIVALVSMLKAVECGYQAAIMAPTEILAEQHLRSIQGYAEELGLNIAFLKSGLTKKAREANLEAIKSGRADIAIGTHSLIEDRVEFHKLGVVVIDEQHRFGVIQRAALRERGANNPDVLVMTATPIPRTLAMTVYGDLDVSVIDEMPPGRPPVKTLVFYEDRGSRRRAYDIVRGEIERGRQAYVVYSLIEESESPDFKDLKYAVQMAEELQKEIFPEFRVGILHGRMKGEEKDAVMRRFLARHLDILVSTTVIEVGVDVPNATVMVVENAERFGLSQLHQLRGRVGRGGHESFCVLISSYRRSQDAEARLSMMEKTTDGFRIAEADLTIRGPGDFLGTKQSGLPEFRFANLIRDVRILSEARDEAFKVVEGDPTLSQYPTLLGEVLVRWQGRLRLAGIS